MTIRQARPLPWATYLIVLVLATAAILIATLGASTPKAQAYWVCDPAAAVVRGPDFRCQHGTNRPTISYIEKNSSPRAYAVYRSTSYGGGSISGSEFYSTTADYFLQDFSCNPGYPNAHNRHTVNVTVQFTLAGSC